MSRVPADPASAAAAAEKPSTAPYRGPDDVRAGVFWMVTTTLLFVCVTGIVRHVGSSLPAAETAFLRYLFGLVLILPFMGGLRKNRPDRRTWWVFGARGVLHGLGVVLWFYAMARIPIAEVTALGYITPIFVTIGAALFLRETLRLRRVAAVGVGLLGAMIIIRPGFQEINSGQLAQLAAAPLFAGSYLMAKRLTSNQDSAVIVGLLSGFVTITLFPLALAQWQTPSLEQLAWLALTAVFATGGHYTMTRAIQAAPITVTQPVQFLQLVWATALGIIVFGEALDPYVIVGGGIVVAAATFISHREAMAARQTTPPAAATKL
ncbi:MAG: EamA family transporter [Rhodobacteraceae bacterium]|nr:EamA family transporter [Paracoccaceae bacterium]MBR28612.1 EamA family transporter [Paracoccaceae bacterium]